MKAILDLLHNNEPLAQKLRSAQSLEDAAELLAAASQKRGHSVNASEIAEWLENRPQGGAEELSDSELSVVAGGLAAQPTTESKYCSLACCVTCRSTTIIY